MKIILGTSNFGAPYGISNPRKKLSTNEIKKILKIAKVNKISFLDTAYNYKNSEKIIGKFTNTDDFRIITKLPKIKNNLSLIESYIKKSLKRLRRKKLYAVLVHSIEDLNSPNLKKILHELNLFKKKKLIKKIGVSVYKVDNLNKIIKKNKIDIVQFPSSIFDLRFLNTNLLSKLKMRKIEILVRSIFLQGVIFLNSKKLKKKFKKDSKKIIEFKENLKNDRDKMINYCLSFINNYKDIDGIVLGIKEPKNLLQIISNNKRVSIKNVNKYAINNENILIPYNWKRIE